MPRLALDTDEPEHAMVTSSSPAPPWTYALTAYVSPTIKSGIMMYAPSVLAWMVTLRPWVPCTMVMLLSWVSPAEPIAVQPAALISILGLGQKFIRVGL